MKPIKVILKGQSLDFGTFGALVFDEKAIKDQEVLDKQILINQLKQLALPTRQTYVLELSSEVLFQKTIASGGDVASFWSAIPIAPAAMFRLVLTNGANVDLLAGNRELFLAIKQALNQVGWQSSKIYPENRPDINLLPKYSKIRLVSYLLIALLVSLMLLAVVLVLDKQLLNM